MKSKYYLALILVGILPVIAVTGVYFWMLFNQPQAPKAPAVNPAQVQATILALKNNVDAMATAMSAAIARINNDIPNLYAHNTDTDLDNFVKTHGASGIVVLSQTGKVEKNIPAAPPLITDPAYGTSEEFLKTAQKLKDNGGKPYLFYTLKLGYPAFVFAEAVAPNSIAEVIVSLANFFRDINTHNGDMFLLEAGSGNIFYHTNNAKVGQPFNPNQEKWLTEIQSALAEKSGGFKFNPDAASGVYSPVFAKFGIVHIFPSSILSPPSPVEPKTPQPSLENLPQLVQTPMSLAMILALAWVLIVGSIFFGLILSPLRKASGLILSAANGNDALNAETSRRFGKDEVGQIVQAVSALMEKLQTEKQQITQDKEESVKKARGLLEEKTREAANQVAEAQKQASTTRGELNDKNSQLNDKLKELDALKAMSEGLRNQTEQAKIEIGKLKTQVMTAEQSKTDMDKKLAETQGQLDSQFKEMESKLLQAMGSSSAIKVSVVRAAAIRTMSEELKTTLGIIKGYVSSALGTTQGGINEKQQEFLGMVINRSARLEKFINDLVDIYQIEIEQQDAKYEEVNLAAEIEGLAFNFQAQAEVKNIKMKVEGKPDVPKVPIVRKRFNQLWNILYLQIIKDAPRGSSIPITVEKVGEIVKVTAQDPGLVATPESLPKLFDEFYDPKHPASPQLAGTGLKLALVKTILSAHGGGAVAEKAEPGTKLILTFPIKIKKPGEAPVPSKPVAPPLGTVGASPSVTAPGIKPSLMPPGGIGVRPAAPGIGMPGIAKPAAPGLTPPSLGMPKPPAPGTTLSGGMAPPSLGMPKPSVPPALPHPAPGLPKPAVPGTPLSGGMAPPPGGLPKPPAAPGLLDALLAGKPAGAPPSAVPPTVPKPPTPSSPMPGAPTVGAPPSAPKAPAPGGPGFLDALIDKKPASSPAPGAPGLPVSAVPIPPKPAMPPMPPSSGVPGAPAMTKPPMPGVPPMPGMPPTPAPVMPPKVVPTAMKPAPAPGVLDLDSADGMKLDANAPKPAAPPSAAPKPPMPGAPGMPPGGLNAAAKPVKKDDGELIE